MANMNIFISFCGTKTDPIWKCFKRVDAAFGIDKVYLIYKDFTDVKGVRAIDSCEALAKQMYENYDPENFKHPIQLTNEGFGNKSYADKVFMRFMPGQSDFNLDRVLDTVVGISTENGNPKIYMSITNGNQVFTCAMGIAAHMLGASIYYTDLKPTSGDGVRLIKDCDAPDATNLKKPEKNIMKALGEMYKLHESKIKRPISDVDSVCYEKYESPKTAEDPVHTDNTERTDSESNIGYTVLQKEISEYTASYWSTALSPSMVSAYIHSLADKHLIEILDAIIYDKRAKKNKVSNKYNAIRLTVQGRLVISRL